MNLEDLLILSTMGPPGGGRTFITNRVIRHFNILAYTELSDDIIIHIFKTLLIYFMKKFP
jgi:dynein heavy chain